MSHFFSWSNLAITTQKTRLSNTLIDFRIKKATLIKDNWLKVVKEVEYPIYNVETVKELLPFYAT